jgi:hypothetical protein
VHIDVDNEWKVKTEQAEANELPMTGDEVILTGLISHDAITHSNIPGKRGTPSIRPTWTKGARGKRPCRKRRQSHGSSDTHR